MLAYMRKIQDARRRDDGASAVEYGLIIAAVAAVIVVAVIAFGGFVRGVFDETCKSIKSGAPAPAGSPDCTAPPAK